MLPGNIPVPDGLTKEVVAKVLGYASICSWLCAQAPQVLKNWRNSSCEGLALPFLVTWLFGDITNLIGCLLTDQLPFQTYLAIYFCLIDMCLVCQYFYFTRQARLRLSMPATPSSLRIPQTSQSPQLHQSLFLPQSQHSLLSPAVEGAEHKHVRSASHPSLSRQPSHGPHSGGSRPGRRRHPVTSFTTSNHHLATDGSYQAIFEAALDVARAAERVRSGAGAGRSRSRRPLPLRHNTEVQHSGEEDVTTNMLESFHSGRSSRSELSAGHIHESPTDMVASTGTLTGRRGRQMHRSDVSLALPENEAVYTTSNDTSGEALHDLIQGEAAAGRRPRSKSRSVSMARGSSGRGTGRRAAGVAFMGLWCFFGINGFGTGGVGLQGLSRQPRGVGRVVPNEEMISGRYWAVDVGQAQEDTSRITTLNFISTFESNGSNGTHSKPESSSQSIQRMIGRVSAWTCTTLYLSSRLPQIWLNFTRKSVEGLSILLFVFAFGGNLCYVISILLNPSGSGDPSEALHYLLEALPYLLGSGGTLLFDVTIMLQAAVYGSRPPVPSTPLRRTHIFRRPRRRAGLEDGETRPLLIDRQRSASPLVRRKADAQSVVVSPNEAGLQIRFGSDRPARKSSIVPELEEDNAA